MNGQEILIGVGCIATGVALIYRIMTTPSPTTVDIKQYPPNARCEMCGRNKKIVITQTCTQLKRAQDCPIELDHIHVKCENCGAEYIQRARRWYDGIW